MTDQSGSPDPPSGGVISGESPPVRRSNGGNSATDADDGLPGDQQLETLRTAQTEAREVLDKQVDAIDDVDDKAAYAIRLNILLVGLLLTLGSLVVRAEGGTYVERFGTLPMFVGLVCSMVSITTAIWAYTSTDVMIGFSAADLRQIRRQAYDEREFLDVLLRNYRRWLGHNTRINHRDGNYLFRSHVFLFLALNYYGAGVAIGFFSSSLTIPIQQALVVGLGTLTLGILFLPRTRVWQWIGAFGPAVESAGLRAYRACRVGGGVLASAADGLRRLAVEATADQRYPEPSTVTMTDERLLALLQDRSLTVAEIADEFGISPGAAERRCVKLRSNGLIRRIDGDPPAYQVTDVGDSYLADRDGGPITPGADHP